MLTLRADITYGGLHLARRRDAVCTMRQHGLYLHFWRTMK
jgi:hypothetical protein